MARHVWRGAGMTERLVKVAETREEAIAALEAFDALIPEAQPGDWIDDARMRENAKRCDKMLSEVGLEDTGACVADRRALEAAGSGEGSAAWIAAHWLAEYHTYQRCRERMEAGDTSARNLAQMASAVHEMGRAQEEMRWRPGVDPKTGRARESLALSGRAYRVASDDGAAQRRGQTAERTLRVLEEMQRLIVAGYSISSAAEISAKNELRSAKNADVSDADIRKCTDANRALWYRHKKSVTDP